LALEDFHSESVQESFDKIGEPVPEGMKKEPVKWSEPADGVATIRGLLARVGEELGPDVSFKNEQGRDQTVSVARLTEDLQAMDAVLEVAATRGSKFRLRIDI